MLGSTGRGTGLIRGSSEEESHRQSVGRSDLRVVAKSELILLEFSREDLAESDKRVALKVSNRVPVRAYQILCTRQRTRCRNVVSPCRGVSQVKQVQREGRYLRCREIEARIELLEGGNERRCRAIACDKVQRARESDALRGRHKPGLCLCPLIAAEEKRPIFNDRAAKREAALVAARYGALIPSLL